MTAGLRFHQVEVRVGERRFTFPLTGPVLLASPGVEEFAGALGVGHVDFTAIGKFISDSRVTVREHVAAAARAVLEDRPDAQHALTLAFEEAFGQVAEEGRAQVRREIAKGSSPARRVLRHQAALINLRLLAATPRAPKRSIGLVVDVATGASQAVAAARDATLQRLTVLGTDPAETVKRTEAAVMAAVDREARDGVTLALNAGRMTEAEELGPDARALYTSLLDENRCEWCKQADDGVPRKLDDPIRLANRPPNPNCYGWTRCRCIEVYTFDDGDAEEPFTLGQGFDPNQPRDFQGRWRNTGSADWRRLEVEGKDSVADESFGVSYEGGPGWVAVKYPAGAEPSATGDAVGERHSTMAAAKTAAEAAARANLAIGPTAPGPSALGVPAETPVPKTGPGRGAGGGLRNFEGMGDEKLAGVLGELVHTDDVEAKQAALAAARKRGWGATPAAKPAAAAAAPSPAPVVVAPVTKPEIVGGLPTISAADVHSAAPMRFQQAEVTDVPKYVADPAFVFQQKIDGIRGQLVLQPGEPPRFVGSVGGTIVSTTAAITTKPILAAIGDYHGPPVVVDGEILEGKFHVFDLVIPGGEQTPYADRRRMADAWVNAAGIPGVQSLPTAVGPEQKQAMYDKVMANGGEGVMMKHLDSPYTPGGRVKHTLKAKFRSTVDAVIMERDRDGHSNFILGLYDHDGVLKEIGSSSAIGKPDGQVGDVIEVAYLYAMPGTNSIVQPSVVKLRPDKKPEDATAGQLRFVSKDVLDLEQLAFSSAESTPSANVGTGPKVDDPFGAKTAHIAELKARVEKRAEQEYGSLRTYLIDAKNGLFGPDDQADAREFLALQKRKQLSAPEILAQELHILLAAGRGRGNQHHDPGGKGGGQFAKADAIDEGVTAPTKSGRKPGAAASPVPSKTPSGAAAPATSSSKGKYSNENFRPATAEDQKRLGYPPGWTDVRVNPNPEGGLQAIGTDRKGRTVRAYSAEHRQEADKAKFEKLRALNERMPAIVKRIEEDAADGNQAAIAALLIQRTGLRPGSTADTGAEEQAYGASTLKDEHVTIEGSMVRLTFVGKHGKRLNIPVEDEQLATILQERLDEDPGGELFQVDDAGIRTYLSGVQEGLRPKDFRTFLATATAYKLAREIEPPQDESSYRKAKRQIAERVSTLLGNTPTVALASYIDPSVFSEWAAVLKIKVEQAQTTVAPVSDS